MTAYQLQLLTGSGISRQEVLGPLQSSISSSGHVCTALSLQAAYMRQDGLAFMHLMSRAPHLMQCLAHVQMRAMRYLALEQLSSSHTAAGRYMAFCSISPCLPFHLSTGAKMHAKKSLYALQASWAVTYMQCT